MNDTGLQSVIATGDDEIEQICTDSKNRMVTVLSVENLDIVSYCFVLPTSINDSTHPSQES